MAKPTRTARIQNEKGHLEMTNVHVQRAGLRAFSALLLTCVAGALLTTPALGATSEDKAEFSVKAGALSFSTTPPIPTLKEVTPTGGSPPTTTPIHNFS